MPVLARRQDVADLSDVRRRRITCTTPTPGAGGAVGHGARRMAPTGAISITSTLDFGQRRGLGRRAGQPVWKTDASGNPAWQADASGTSYTASNGVMLVATDFQLDTTGCVVRGLRGTSQTPHGVRGGRRLNHDATYVNEASSARSRPGWSRSTTRVVWRGGSATTALALAADGNLPGRPVPAG